MLKNSTATAAGERPSKVGLARDRANNACRPPRLWLATDGKFVPGIRQAAERPADQHVDLRHGVRRQPFQVRLPSRLAMAEGLRPLPEAADERRSRNGQRAAPGSEDVDLRVLRGHAALVLDDVPGAGAALDRHVAQARVHREVDAVEVVEGAADVVGERSGSCRAVRTLPGFTSWNVSG